MPMTISGPPCQHLQVTETEMTNAASQLAKDATGVLTTRAERTSETDSAGITLTVRDAEWIEDLLLFFCRWFAEDEVQLEDDLEAWTGGGPCRIRDLIVDLARAILLLRSEPLCEPRISS